MRDRRVGGDSSQTRTAQQAAGMKLSWKLFVFLHFSGRLKLAVAKKKRKLVKCLTKRWQTVWQNKTNYTRRMKWRHKKPGCFLKGCSCQIMSCRYMCGQPYKAAKSHSRQRNCDSAAVKRVAGRREVKRSGGTEMQPNDPWGSFTPSFETARLPLFSNVKGTI